MGAPVCNLNPKSQVPASKAPTLPSIPLANDLASALAALNAIRQWILQFRSEAPTGAGNTTFILNPNQQGNPNNPNNYPGAVGNFSELPERRVTTTTRIYDPNDPTQETYIDVKQITGLAFANRSGQLIQWTQGSS